MYYVYVIKSKEHDFFYKGFCKNLDLRLTQHNSGMTKSIKKFLPFYVKYYEVCNSLNEAINKEKYWKTAAGRRYLKNKMN